MDTQRKILVDAIVTCIEQDKEIKRQQRVIGFLTVACFVLALCVVRLA